MKITLTWEELLKEARDVIAICLFWAVVFKFGKNFLDSALR